MTLFAITTLLLGCAPKKSPAPTQKVWVSELAVPTQTAPVLQDSVLDLGSATVELRGEPFQSLYKKIAPKTVIVHASNANGVSYGTGVVVDKKGLILTNDHVVIGGTWTPDLQLNVNIEFGEMGERKMIRSSKKLAAKVIKRDPFRDLALVQLIEMPPHKLKPIKIARKGPETGQAVAALGHAGLGLLWALKQCDVAGIGMIGTDLATLLLSDDETDDGEILRSNQGVKTEYEGMNAGYLLQTDCDIAPGDSGGPLIDGKGRLVGLNSFGIDGSQEAFGGVAQVSAFHVDREEIASFLKDIPEDTAWLPDIWKSNGPYGEIIDKDSDGNYDVLVLAGEEGYTEMFDLDQDSPASELDTLIADRTWDAEIVTIIKNNQPAYAFYDTNNDKKFDRVLVYFEDEDTCSYANLKAGKKLKLKPTTNCFDSKMEWFTDAKVVQEVATRQIVSGELDNPNIVPSFDITNSQELQYLDVDKNGVEDSAFVFGSAIIRAISSLNSEPDIRTAISGRKEVDYGLMILGDYESSQKRWYAYNSDATKDLDLVLFSGSWGLGPFVDKAWRKNGDSWELDPTFVGGQMVGNYNKKTSNNSNLFAVIDDHPVAETPFSTIYPYPVAMDDYAEIRQVQINSETDGSSSSFAVMVNETEWGRYVSIDLDRDAANTITPGEFYEGELYIIESAKYKWLWYDHDNNGEYDTMILATANNNVLRVGQLQSGTFIDDPALAELVKDHLLSPAIFTDPELQSALQLFVNK